jgi:gas vesicle protein
MDCFKGAMVGMAMGLMVGAVIGASNCNLVCDFIKKGRRELKKMKKRYRLM